MRKNPGKHLVCEKSAFKSGLDLGSLQSEQNFRTFPDSQQNSLTFPDFQEEKFVSLILPDAGNFASGKRTVYEV